MVNEGLIEPQLAMKALTAFDKAATEVLGEKVKAKLVFKVCSKPCWIWMLDLVGLALTDITGSPRYLSFL